LQPQVQVQEWRVLAKLLQRLAMQPAKHLAQGQQRAPCQRA
jgi:hypothetical protein